MKSTLIHIVTALCLLCTCPMLTAQTTDDSSGDTDPFWTEFFPHADDCSSRELPKQVSKEDSLYYASLSDSIIPVRSGVAGDTKVNPIQAGTYSDSFSYTDTRNTATSFTNQYGRNTSDVYYRLVLTVPMNVTFTHQGSFLSDTYMYLLDSNGSLITSNDDYSGEGHCSSTLNSFIRRQLPAGTYFVVSEGYWNDGFITTNITGSASTAYNYPTIPSSYSTMPGTAVGGLGATTGVSPMGGATCSIPIEVPPGLGDMQPQLAIVYNSQSGNGLCGYGANLSGLSSITRGPKNIYHDGTAQGMKYLADDALYLDGVRLILDENSTAGQNNAVYYPESDPFTRVITNGTCTSTTNDIWFEVQSSDGMIYRYGYNPDSNTDTHSRLSYMEDGAQKIHSWYLSYVLQPTGNYMTYTYLIEDNCVYPSQISYGKNTAQGNSNTLNNLIEFSYYLNRADSIPIVFDGKRGSMKKRLKTITTRTNSSTFRTYTLNYNTTGDGTALKFSRLTSVTESNGQNESLPSTQLNWSYLPAVNYATSSLSISPSDMSSATVPFERQSFSSCDLNGDGIDDLIGIGRSDNEEDRALYVYKYKSARTESGIVSLTNSGEYSFTPSYTSISGNIYSISYILSFYANAINGTSSIDFDGDGNNEALIAHFCRLLDPNTSNPYYNMEFYMLENSDNLKFKNTRVSSGDAPLYAIADIDNDGRSDIVVLETTFWSGNLTKLHIISSSVSPSDYTYNEQWQVLSASLDYNIALRSTPKKLLLADINGNGLQDMLVLYSDAYDILWNQGGGVSPASSLYSNNITTTDDACHHYGEASLKDNDVITYGDFNGDGLLDALTKESHDWYMYLNNGNGSFTKTVSCISDASYYAHINIHCNIVDFDGDGRSDVIITDEYHLPYAGMPFQSTHTRWMRSTGTSLIQVYDAISAREDDALASRYTTGDFDGDGRVELVNYGYDCVNGNNADSDPIWRIYKNSSLTVQSGKVTSITGDYGVTTAITYSTLADGSVYTRGNSEGYPAPRYTIPLNVVRQTVQSGGAAGDQTVKYSYTGLRAHLRGKGLLGFSKTVANNTTAGIKTESGVTQWDTTFYTPKVIYSKTTYNGYTEQTTSTLTVVDKQYRKYFAYPSVIVNTDMDGYSVTTHRHYNTDYGYIISDTTFYGTNMFRATRYHNYTEAGAAFHPQTIVTGQRHPDDNSGAFTRTTTYLYNNHGFVTRKTENKFSEDSLVTEYAYDLYGNMERQTSTGSGITTPCTTRYSYDATHRFPVRIYTSPASSEKRYTYDIWGNILTEKDSINSSANATTTNTYDGWGNLIRTQYADGSEVTYTRGWNNDAGKRYFVLTQGTARPWVKTWYDNSGREVHSESVGANNVSVVSTTYYNPKGQITSRSSTEGSFTTGRGYTYDSRGRLTREQGPGGLDITYNYSTQGNGIITETVSENGRNTTYVRDAWGNITSVTAPISSVTNKYSSNGGIKTTICGGDTLSFQYDDCGNRTSLIDPDAGTTTYEYDALGRETKRTDARGVVFLTNYDYLGRVTQRKAGSETITYTYGTSSTGQTRLISESYNGWTKSYTYDGLGRVTGETMSKGNTISKSRSYTYDSSNGLLSTRTMPGGKTIQYSYDAYGNTTGVDFESGTIAWSLTGYNGRRTTSQIVLDNNSIPFEKTILLDQYGHLDSLKTIQPSQWGPLTHQLEKYTFDPIRGNLTQKQGQYDMYPVSYTYDNADRLRTATENNSQRMAVTYSVNGNILSKTGIGSYTYGSTSHPHAVTEVDNTNGNIGYNEQQVYYNSWGKISSAWSYDPNDFYYYSVEYGPDLQRVWTQLDKTYNIEYSKYYWDDYEEKTTGSLTTRYWYINGPDGLIGIYIEEQTPSGTVSIPTVAATDHLGSIEGLFGNNNYCYFAARYDEWGDRDVMLLYGLSHGFDRGYTGHEHIDGLGLINMNGRMYDPLLGRFLSPDDYIQSPSNPQNYNRYSYCLNNPLKYTDPNGEIFGAPLGFLSDLIDNAIRLFNGDELDWTQTILGLKIDLGFFILDGNKSRGAQAWELASRFLWQPDQIILGDLLASSFNAIGQVYDVSYGYGMTALDMGLDDGDAVTLGYLTAGPDGYRADWRDHTFVHEYGHYIQSQEYGPLFLKVIGYPSLQSAILQTDNPDSPRHRNRWFEADASYKGAEYFDKYYGSGNEDYKEDSEDFFDINSFKTGKESLYTNPRTNEKNERYHPTSAIFHWTDIIIYFPVIGLIPWFWYK